MATENLEHGHSESREWLQRSYEGLWRTWRVTTGNCRVLQTTGRVATEKLREWPHRSGQGATENWQGLLRTARVATEKWESDLRTEKLATENEERNKKASL